MLLKGFYREHHPLKAANCLQLKLLLALVTTALSCNQIKGSAQRVMATSQTILLIMIYVLNASVSRVYFIDGRLDLTSVEHGATWLEAEALLLLLLLAVASITSITIMEASERCGCRRSLLLSPSKIIICLKLDSHKLMKRIHGQLK